MRTPEKVGVKIVSKKEKKKVGSYIRFLKNEMFFCADGHVSADFSDFGDMGINTLFPASENENIQVGGFGLILLSLVVNTGLLLLNFGRWKLQ